MNKGLEMLAKWDELFAQGKFPTPPHYYNDKFYDFAARLDVFVAWRGGDCHTLVIFQIFGYAYASDTAAYTDYCVVSGTSDQVGRSEGVFHRLTCPKPTCEDEDEDEDEDYTRLQRFVVRIDDTEHVLEPTWEDCENAELDGSIDEFDYDENPAISLESVARLTAAMLPDRVLSDPRSHPRFAEHFAVRDDADWIHLQTAFGNDFYPFHPVDSDAPEPCKPSESPRWRQIAEQLAASEPT